MLIACANFVTEQLILRKVIPQSQRPIFVYGLELLFSTGMGMLSIFLLSLLLGDPLSGLMFLLVFVGLRLFAGGYHATTYLRCFLLSNSVFLLTYLLAYLLRYSGFLPEALPLVLLSTGVIIFFLAPIRHKKHPLSPASYAYNRRIARALAIVFLGMFFILFLSGQFPQITATIAASLAAVAGMMVLAVYVERRRKV